MFDEDGSLDPLLKFLLYAVLALAIGKMLWEWLTEDVSRWDGTAWHRPGQVLDRAFEHYDPRPVRAAATVTAADLLAQPATPDNVQISKIADFTASNTPLPNWRDHLALWAQQRHRLPAPRPLDQCVVDLRAPELEPARLVDWAGLAKIAGIALKDLPHPERGRRHLPPPQVDSPDGPRWSEPVARDWAEQRRSADGPVALLAGTTTFGTSQPRGLVTDHNLLTKIIKDGLEDEDAKSTTRRFAKTDEKRTQETAATLAWWPAVALSEGPGSIFPMSALRTTLIEAVVGGLADDVERSRKWEKDELSLGDIRTDVVKLLDWYILRDPDATPGLFGDILLIARTRLDLAPEQVGSLLRRSFHLDSELDGETIDTLLDMALPPSAKRAEDR